MTHASALSALIILICLMLTFRYHPKFRKYRVGKQRTKHILNLVMMVLGGISGIVLWYVLFE